MILMFAGIAVAFALFVAQFPSQYSIADAMFAPVALRFDGYGIPVDGVEKAYIESVLKQPCIIEWMEAGRAETEIISWDPVPVNNGRD